MWETHREGIPLVLFPVAGKGWSDADARHLITNLEEELPKRNPHGALEAVRQPRDPTHSPAYPSRTCAMATGGGVAA